MSPRVPRTALLAATALAAAAMGGCLQRRIVVTSDPPGAVVWVNNQEIGRTPAETGFLFYGTYDVRLRKEGFEPVTVARKARSPWYEYPGPDLVASGVPVPFRKTVRWHFDLEPLPAPGEGERAALLDRAEDLRLEATPPPDPATPPSANPR